MDRSCDRGNSWSQPASATTFPTSRAFGGAGRSVFHCPYCDGWEIRDQPIAIYGQGARGVGLSLELTGWSRDLVLCTDGDTETSADDRDRLARNRIRIREERVTALEGHQGMLQRIRFDSGETLVRSAMFFTTGQFQRSELAVRLGCEINDKGTVRTGKYKSTHLAGLYVAGDASRAVQWVIVAAAEGAEAAFAINTDLIRGSCVIQRQPQSSCDKSQETTREGERREVLLRVAVVVLGNNQIGLFFVRLDCQFQASRPTNRPRIDVSPRPFTDWTSHNGGRPVHTAKSGRDDVSADRASVHADRAAVVQAISSTCSSRRSPAGSFPRNIVFRPSASSPSGSGSAAPPSSARIGSWNRAGCFAVTSAGARSCAQRQSRAAHRSRGAARSASAALRSSDSTLRDAIRHSSDARLLSLAAGEPAIDCFPTAAFQQAIDHVLKRDADAVWSHGPTEGRPNCATRLPSGSVSPLKAF